MEEWKFKAEVDKDKIQKITKEQDTVISDFMDFNSENKRLKEELKHP